MAVRAVEMVEQEVDRTELMQKWGYITEHLDSEMRDAIQFVLGWEQSKIDTEPNPGTVGDYERICVEAGARQGIGLAFDALTNRHYIADERQRIQLEIEQAKEQDSDGR